MTPTAERVLVAGGGFVGRHLARALVDRGARVVMVSRRGGDPVAGVEVLRGDLARGDDRRRVLRGVGKVVWLVHSLDRADYASRDPRLAEDFARDAHALGVSRTVYLGALGDGAAAAHTASRHATGEALRRGGLSVVELRAAVVLGAGSAVFEMVRALVERLPVLVVPAGAGTLVQPIAVDDLARLLADAVLGDAAPGVWEVAGDEVLSYRDLMTRYAALRGLRRPAVTMPVATPRLSGLTIGALTPLSAVMGRALVENLGHPAVLGASGDGRVRRFGQGPYGTVHEALVRAMWAAGLRVAEGA